MKTKLNKIIVGLAVVSILAPSVSFSQTNEALASVIVPAKNRGYLNWVGDGSPKYKVEVFEKTGENQYILLSTKTTENNYTKMDPMLFTMPNLFYKISGLDANNEVLTVGDVLPNEVPPNAGGGSYLCRVKCNGRTYAWSMAEWQTTISNGNGGQIPTDKFVEFTGTDNFYDEANGIYVPFYQAFSPEAYNQLIATNSPYLRSSNPYGIGALQYLYQHYDISSALGGGPFYDKNNVEITNGFVVEKKLDQFNPYSIWNTGDHTPSEYICLAPLVGSGSWISFFNTNKEGDYGTGICSDWTNYFTPITDISCLASQAGGGGGVDHTNFGHTVVDAIDFFGCVQTATSTGENGTTYTSLLPCLSSFMSASNNNGNVVSGVVFRSILDRSTNIQFTNTNGSARLISDRNAAKLTKGLYFCDIYTENEGIVPTVVEFKSDMREVKTSDLVSLEITPNPVTTSKLSLKVTSLEGLPVQVRVFNLAGETVYSAQETLIADETLEVSVDILNANVPYNQLRVSLIFTDGSVINQTALIAN